MKYSLKFSGIVNAPRIDTTSFWFKILLFWLGVPIGSPHLSKCPGCLSGFWGGIPSYSSSQQEAHVTFVVFKVNSFITSYCYSYNRIEDFLDVFYIYVALCSLYSIATFCPSKKVQEVVKTTHTYEPDLIQIFSNQLFWSVAYSRHPELISNIMEYPTMSHGKVRFATILTV